MPAETPKGVAGATASKSCWHIYREGRKVSVVANMDGSEITPETVAQFLLQADNDAQLKPRRAIW